MTSSEPEVPRGAPQDPPAGGAEAPSVRGAAVLRQGHLHPAVLVLRLLDGLRNAVLPVAFGLLVEPWLLVLGALLFLVHLGHGVVRYLTFQYVLTESELITREGVLNRQERRIPLDRVQDLGFESTILRRVLGIAVVRVETASGRGAEALLDSLGRGDAEDLREVLLRTRSDQARAVAGEAAAPAPAAEPEWIVFRSQAGELLLRGLSDLRLGAIVVAGFAALELAHQLDVVVHLQGAADSFAAWVRSFPPAVAIGLLLLVVGVVVGVSVVASAIGNLMAFHGFVLTLREDSLLCRYGLFTTRQKTLPRARVQRVRVEQTWLRRLLGVAVVRADSAGTSRGTGEEAPGGLDVIVPLADLRRVEPLLPAALPQLGGLPERWERAPRRLVLRVFLKGALWVAVLALATAAAFGVWALLWLALLPAAWLVGRLAWGNLAWHLEAGHLLLRWGILGLYQAYVPTGKVQAVALLRGPVQRLLGLADLAVFVAGGPPTRLPDLALADARGLLGELSARAAVAAVREWRGTPRLNP